MIKKLIIAIAVLSAIADPGFSQVKSRFSGELSKYREELNAYLGPNLTPAQTASVNAFLLKWDSTGFSNDNMVKIIDISAKLASRNFRPSPHFINFLNTLTAFTGYTGSSDFINNWLTGLSKSVVNQAYTNDNLDRYFRNTGAMIESNTIYEAGSVKWKIKGDGIKFRYDTIFKIIVSDVTLIALAVKDSTEISRVSGIYYPEITEFRGSKGIITWEKAGFKREEVFAEITDFIINTQRTSFVIDSARLSHKTYFKEPVIGKLTDQPASYSTPDKAIFPRFETYIKQFLIKDLYKGVNYEGGLTLEGASVKGTGENYLPAKITLYRNDTLYVKILSKSYLFSKMSIATQEASATLFLDKDSIYHSSLGFSYNTENRLVNLYRTNNPVSKSPFYDSFHGIDMFFENMSWNMNESKITMTRARGSSLGQARFESVSFYNSNTFERLMGMDNEHPLYNLKKFSEWYYSKTFPISEFAHWLNKPFDAVTGLCIDLATKGFLFYDRTNNEVTIKGKVDDYLTAYAKRKDYDVISIYSETEAPQDNAVLDLKNFRLTVNGVPEVFLSDSQRVVIYPYNYQVVIGRNRDLSFDGVVSAGLFTIFGHKFTFSYDTFKIRLQSIDSIRIAVETDKRDNFGNPVISDIDNLIQLTTAELYIDNPSNKSGLRSYQQYPIINAVTYSYIFFDKLPGLDNIYKQSDFFFRIDPFTYENIDHYRNDDMSLIGEFHGGNIIKPTRQYLTIQEDNSLGFSMNIPDEGIGVYNGKGQMYNSFKLNNKGLSGTGTLKRLSSTTMSDDFRFFPDSMITMATSFNIEKDLSGRYPDLQSRDVSVIWMQATDEWFAENSEGKNFDMFGNGTVLDGKLNLTPNSLKGSGAVEMSDSRIISKNFTFASSTIQADTSDYNLKSLQGTGGYAFVAENVNSTIDFNIQQSKFSLNTDSSVVKFPEIEYICTMTDFMYDMKSRILSMEQRGKASTTLLPAEQLLKLDYARLDKPTFFSTNVIRDTISFSSWKGSFNLQEEYVEAENINYIHIADALIQPENGKIVIGKRATIRPLLNAIIAVNRRHILHSANISIENSKRYSGSALYNYVDETRGIEQINFPEITVDSATTTAKGYIPISQKFLLSPAFSFSGDVGLSARADFLTFTGAAGVVHNCSTIKSYNVKFKASVNPQVVMIPLSENPRDINDNLVFSGTFINIDSTHIYPAFLSERKSWSDVQMVKTQGLLYFDRTTGRYKISSREKLADPTLPGDLVTFDKNYCIVSGEGKLNFGANFDLLKMASAGKVIQTADSGNVNIESLIALDFYFSDDALKIMSDEIRMMPTLTAVNLNTDLYKKGMKDLLGETAANQINEEMGLFGTSRNLPKEYTYKLFLNDVKLFWNQPTASFRSKGKIGVGFIGTQAVNVYMEGFVEIQRRRSGDLIDIYLKADNSTWYYFSYFRGVMMTQSSNSSYNTLLSTLKLKDRKHPESSVRVPYTYMIAVEDRLGKFLERMTSDDSVEDQNR